MSKSHKLMEYYSIFRSAEFLSPLWILKEMKNKKLILIYQHLIDLLSIPNCNMEQNLVLNFFMQYDDRFTWNFFANVMELLWNGYLASSVRVCMSGWFMFWSGYVSSHYGYMSLTKICHCLQREKRCMENVQKLEKVVSISIDLQ